VGQTVQVLVEGEAKKSSAQWMGRTDSNLTVVWDKRETTTGPGLLRDIRITRASASTLFGEESAGK
jgi:tRNA-2-methylthio-N6-dimethylallyladenosine synthase